MVSRTAVSKWETGHGYPSLESLMVMSEIFGMRIDDFFSKEDAACKVASEKRKHRKTVIAAVLACMLAHFGIISYTSYMASENDIFKAIGFNLKNFNYQMIETSQMIDFAYNEGQINTEMFDEVCKNLYLACEEFRRAEEELSDYRQDIYSGGGVTVVAIWATEIYTKTQVGTENLSEQDIYEIYDSIKLICDGWSSLEWNELFEYGAYDFVKDPGDIKNHMYKMKMIANDEIKKISN